METTNNDYIEYRKPHDEVYHIRQREPIPKVRRVSLWLVAPFLLLLALGVYLVFNGLSRETSGQTEYQVSGDIDYQVYLKENDYYTEKYLGPGMQYIASLIDTVRLDYDYTLETNTEINANYTYDLIATAVATDRSDQTKILYTRKETIKSNQITPMESGTIQISDKVNLNYRQYNEYMRSFRTDFGIAANCFLEVKLVVKVDGAIQTEDTLAAHIPLSDQTINIGISAEGINRAESIGEPQPTLVVANQPILIVGSIMAAVSLASAVLVVYLYVTRFGDNWYAEAEWQIKRKYDTLIVDATSSYHEQGEVVRVGDFLELVDASQAEGLPIVRYDVDPEYKSYYVVGSNNGLTTYRYTLSRTYQDELCKTNQPKEQF